MGGYEIYSLGNSKINNIETKINKETDCIVLKCSDTLLDTKKNKNYLMRINNFFKNILKPRKDDK